MAEWKEILEDVKKGIKDLATLEVVTLTGDIKSLISEKGEIPWDTLIKKSKAAQGSIQLVAATHTKIDSDTVQFVTSSTLENMDYLIRIHEAAVQSARENRQAVIEFVKGFIS